MARESSTLNSLLKLISRRDFDQCVQSHDGDKGSKGFSTWNQFVALLYAQLTGKRSLRELESGFNSQWESHYHLNCSEIKRSTLSDANNKRSSEIYQDLLNRLMAQSSRHTKRKGVEILEVLDSTQIKLNKTLYEWAAKGHRLYGIKAHLVYGLEDERPKHLFISNANVNDPILIDDMNVKAGVTYLFDKGYYDFKGWKKIIEHGAHFITRAKKNSAHRVLQSLPILEHHVIKDDLIELNSSKSKVLKGKVFRLVSAVDKEGRPYRLLTDRLNDSAQKLISLYKQRWQIELFFKWIKQNLKIKRFMGRTLNAVRTQIIIALITYLLIKRFHELCNSKKILRYFASEICDRLMRPFRKSKKTKGFKNRPKSPQSKESNL